MSPSMLIRRILHARGLRSAQAFPIDSQYPPQSWCSVQYRLVVAAASWVKFIAYLPPRLASRKSTFFLTVVISVSLPKVPVQSCRIYSPTGSYLSMLRGRWVRGRRKVMKKPVRAIDMRRTATVLDFAVRVVNVTKISVRKAAHTFFRHCVMLNGCYGHQIWT